MAQLETLTGSLRYDYDGGGLKGAIKDLDTLGGKSMSTGKQGSSGMGLLKVGGLAAGAAITGVGLAAIGAGAGLAVSVGKAMDFEAGLSNIKAVSGATADEMDLVKEAALRIGAETSFSASEGAAAIEELVKAGVSVQGVLNGAADAAVALAAAGEVDMPTAAAIASAAMNNFGLAASELPQIADLIAGAANASAISVEDFGYSLSASGAAAALAGFSFDDLSLGITAMGNAGIKGSDAGTSLKTFMMNLIPTTDKQVAAFKDLGLTLEDGSNAFFDAQGNMKSMTEVAGILNAATSDLTAEQKLSTLETLFGSDAIRAAAVIADQGAAGMENLAASMGKVTAAEVAETRLDNLSGSIEAFWGSLETLQIKAGLAFTPVLKLLTDFATTGLNALMPMLDQITPLIEDFFGGLDVGGMMSGLFSGEGLDLGGIGGQFAAMGDSLTEAFSDPAVGEFLANLWERLSTIGAFIMDPLIPIALDLGVAFAEQFAMVLPVVLRFENALHNNLWPIIESILGFVRDNKDVISNWLILTQVPLVALSRGFESLKETFGALGSIELPDFGGMLGGLFGGGEAEAAATDAGGGMASAFAEGFNLEPDMTWLEKIQNGLANTGETGQGFADSLQGLVDGLADIELPELDLAGLIPDMPDLDLSPLTGAFEGAWDEVQGGIESAWASFDSTIQDAQTAIYDYLMGIWEQIPQDIRDDLVLIADHILEQFEVYRQTIEDKLTEAYDTITGWLSDVKSEWDAWLSEIVATATDAWADVKEAIMGPLTEAKTELSSAWAQVEAEARAAWDSVKTAVVDKVNEALAYLSGIRTEIETRARDAWAGVVAAATTALAPLVSAVTDKVNAAITYLTGVKDTVMGKAREIWDGFITATTSALGEFKDKVLAPIRAGIENLKTAVTDAKDKALEIGRSIIDGIVNAVVAGKDRLITAALAGVRGILDAIKAFLGIASPSTVAYSLFTDFVQGGVLALLDGGATLAAAATSAVDSMLSVFDRLTTGDPGGGIAAAIASMDALHAEWVRLQSIADEFNDRDPLAAPIIRMNQALTAFFDGGAAGSLMDLMQQMSGGGYTFNEGDLLERLGFSERSFEEIQQSLAALSGEPERQAKLWGDFIDGLMGDWERYLDKMKAPLEARKRELEALKKAAERDPTQTGTSFDPQIDAVQALIDIWDARNEAIQRALSGQESSVEGIADAYNRVLDAVELVNGAAEDAEQAYQKALKAAQDAVKAMGDSAEQAEDDAYDQAMRLLDAEMRAREKAHKEGMRQLEAHAKWTEADVDRRIAAEEKLHAERMKAITAEVDAEQKRLDAEAERIDIANEAIDRAKNLIDLIEQGGAITTEQADFLRGMGIDPDTVGKVAAGIVQTRAEVDRLALSIEALKGLFDKLPDEIGRVRMAAGELRREFGRRPGSEGGSAGAVSDAEKKRLEDLAGGGTLGKSDQRIVDLFLAGRAVQSQRLRDILGPRIGAEETALANEEKKADAVQKQVDLAGDLLAKLEAQLKVDEDQLTILQRANDLKRDGLAAQLAAETTAFEAFKVAQAARIAAVEAEIDAKKTAYDAEREAIAEAKQAEEDRHDARMRQIQEEYALELLKLGKTDAEVQAILEAQRKRAAAIADEAERRFQEMMAAAGMSPAVPNPFTPPGGQPPPGINPPVNPGEGINGAMDGAMTFEQMFGGASSLGADMRELAAAMAPAAAALPIIASAFGGGGGGSALNRDLTNYGIITVGDSASGQREFAQALVEFLGL